MVNYYTYTLFDLILIFFLSGALGPISLTKTEQFKQYLTENVFSDPNNIEIGGVSTSYFLINPNDLLKEKRPRFSTNLFSSDLFLRIELIARSFAQLQGKTYSNTSLFKQTEIEKVLPQCFTGTNANVNNAKLLNVDMTYESYGTYGILQTGK